VSVRPDGIHQRGRSAVLAGRELLDVPPGPGSTRWGLSLDVRLDPAAEQHLDALTTEAAAIAGPGQWLTGARGSSHLTVTYHERTWREVGPDDEEVRRYAALAALLAAGTPSLRWRITGLALADRGVLAMAEPVDPAPGAFRAAVLERLGGLGAEEADYRGSTWWATLVHFAAPVADRVALVDWVDARVSLPPVLVTAERVEVVRYAYDGLRTAPVPLTAAALPGVREGAAGGTHA
jgi:hypothetical protein